MVAPRDSRGSLIKILVLNFILRCPNGLFFFAVVFFYAISIYITEQLRSAGRNPRGLIDRRQSGVHFASLTDVCRLVSTDLKV